MTETSSRPRLRIVTGCTAVGKSAAALAWAEGHGAEIVSCDSLLFYRGMDIGTAKPSLAERSRVRHHLLDLLPVAEPMDVARFAFLAAQAAADIAARGRTVLAVGGSGFYLQAFLRPVADDVAVPAALRSEVAGRLAAGGPAALLAELRTLNPSGLGKLDPANPRRLSRALERCLASGLPLAELARRFAERPAPFAGWDVDLVELTLPAEKLAGRIAARTRAMLEAGLLEEVARLREEGLERNPSASRAIGYRESLAVLDGQLAPGELAGAIDAATRRLVKKQRTWFRTQLPEHRRIPPQNLSATW